MITTRFIKQLETDLGKKLKQKLHIRRITPVSGGSINQAARLDTNAGVYFLKTNDAFRFPLMFEKEAHGLDALRATGTFTIPEIVLLGEEEGIAFLLLKYIDSRANCKDFWERFGSSLAKLHRTTASQFGFSEENYIGSLDQSNKEHNRWLDFFIEERLEKQVALAINTGKMDNSDAALFKKFYMHLDSVIPEEAPALLHGDLWSGNFMSGYNGEPCLFDPAVYFSHREMDLAMTRLFGGFEQPFYDTYFAEYPLSPGFEERVDIHNLYPLMVHVNLFGGNYMAKVRGILKRV